jgi:hypothetical protein
MMNVCHFLKAVLAQDEQTLRSNLCIVKPTYPIEGDQQV